MLTPGSGLKLLVQGVGKVFDVKNRHALPPKFLQYGGIYIAMVKLVTLDGKVSQTVRETQVSRFARKQPGVAAVGGSVSCR